MKAKEIARLKAVRDITWIALCDAVRAHGMTGSQAQFDAFNVARRAYEKALREKQPARGGGSAG